jgi:hypothetical protein
MSSMNGHGPKRAILYARVSTDEQARSGYSLAQQLEALRAYAAREGYEVLEEVSDPGQSGASLERPAMDRVRDLVAAGSVSVVLAQDRDRFAREPAYLLRAKQARKTPKSSSRQDHRDDEATLRFWVQQGARRARDPRAREVGGGADIPARRRWVRHEGHPDEALPRGHTLSYRQRGVA